MNALVVVVCRVYALSMAALSRRSRWVTVCSRRLIVSATWVTCSVLVVAAWLLPLLDAGVPGVSSEKTFLCSHPSLCLSDYGQLVPKTSRTQDNSYPRQVVPRTTRTQDNSYPRRLVPKTSRTQDNSYPGQLVPRTTRTQQFE